MSKYNESYRKQAIVVNQRYHKKAIQEAILCFVFFRLNEKGLVKSLTSMKLNAQVVSYIIHTSDSGMR